MRPPPSHPRGWCLAPLPDLADVNPKILARDPLDDEGISFVPMPAVEAMTGRVDTSQLRPWREVKKGYTRFQEGDVLFAKITPCMENGKITVARHLAGGMGAGSTEFHVVRPVPGLLADFVRYFLLREQFRKDARARMTGTAGQLRVPTSFLEETILPLPPLAEQRRLVEAIESYFTRLDDAEATLERVKRNLERYRASVLQAAVEGRLVPTEAELARKEGRKYECGKELLERVIKNEAESCLAHDGDTAIQRPRPEGWEWTSVARLGDPSEQSVLTGPFGTSMGSLDFVEEGIPVLTIGCLTRSGITKSKAVHVSEAKARSLARYRLRPGDILFSRMATVGRAGLVTNTEDGSLFNYHIMRLRLQSGAIRPTFFIAYVRGSATVTGYVREVNHGMTRDGINTEQLLGMPVPVPPLNEQDRIIAAVESLLSVEDAQAESVRAALQRTARLKQAILSWAFSGHLVDQDPTDEPASALLDRIRAERAKASSPETPRRRSRPRKAVKK